MVSNEQAEQEYRSNAGNEWLKKFIEKKQEVIDINGKTNSKI